jgi:FkbM family methyltransferase
MKLLRSLRRAFLRNPGRDLEAFDAQRRLVATPMPTILDVGAHRGQTARRYRSLFPRATIHCFEPFPPSYSALVEALDGDASVHTHRLALGDSPGAGILNVNRSSATNSLLRSDERANAYWGQDLLDTDATVEVPVTTLDRFCAEGSFAHIDILKLDVQGAEYSVLKGAHSLLAAHAIDVVYMEMITAPTYVGQHELHEYLALFRTHGYSIFDFYNPVRKNGRLLQTDNIMVADPFLEQYERRSSIHKA